MSTLLAGIVKTCHLSSFRTAPRAACMRPKQHSWFDRLCNRHIERLRLANFLLEPAARGILAGAVLLTSSSHELRSPHSLTEEWWQIRPHA
mmetsp:Transcript_29259/g.75412  ORF Transcript_29259/g.75412 Transcript_29259/m.75412 type:complete len:91 (-) Transcript_29259:943-1215(-)